MNVRHHIAICLLACLCLLWAACNMGAKECTDCKGTGKHTCAPCDGHGTITCEWCDGAGKKKCMTCGGKGKKEINDYKYVQEHGQLVYKNVSHLVPCDQCKKTGSVSCAECKGKGGKACAKCFGTGTVGCGTCLGKGKIIREWKLKTR